MAFQVPNPQVTTAPTPQFNNKGLLRSLSFSHGAGSSLVENDWFRRLQIGKEEEGDWGDLPRQVGQVNSW